MTEVHLTKAADAYVSHGWRKLPSGMWVTAQPPRDRTNGARFAHFDYEQLLEVCRLIPGARPIAPERVVELNRYGHRLKPETRTPNEHMSSKAVCDDHDDAVLEQLEGWDGVLPVANAGKPYVAGALPGKSRLFGWGLSASSSSMAPDAFKEWLQPLQNAHNRRHVDYSSLCTLEADEDLGGVDPPNGRLTDLTAPFQGLGAAARVAGRAILDATGWGGLTLGERAVYVARAELAAKVAEVAGPAAHPRIREYLARARRGGSALAGMPGHELEGDNTLGPTPSDEIPWCAASASMCLLMALRPGEEPPHGYRAAVWEVCEDLAARGRLRLPRTGFRPSIGDYVLSGRAGGSPLKRGSGHIERVCDIAYLESGRMQIRTIGGNEQNRWIDAPHAGELDPSFVAWGVVS